MDLLPDRAAWYVVGPLIGLLVAGMFALANKPLGASGAYVQTVAALRKRASEPWRAWYFVGILVGAVIASALQGRLQLRTGYELMLDVWSFPATIDRARHRRRRHGIRSSDGRRLHVGPRTVRDVRSIRGELRCDRDLHERRNRRHVRSSLVDRRTTVKLVGFLFGTAFGFLLALGGLNEYEVIHNMLLLEDFQPYLIMASAVAVAAPIVWVLERRNWTTPFAGPFSPGRVQGGTPPHHRLGHLRDRMGGRRHVPGPRPRDDREWSDARSRGRRRHVRRADDARLRRDAARA